MNAHAPRTPGKRPPPTVADRHSDEADLRVAHGAFEFPDVIAV